MQSPKKYTGLAVDEIAQRMDAAVCGECISLKEDIGKNKRCLKYGWYLTCDAKGRPLKTRRCQADQARREGVEKRKEEKAKQRAVYDPAER